MISRRIEVIATGLPSNRYAPGALPPAIVHSAANAVANRLSSGVSALMTTTPGAGGTPADPACAASAPSRRAITPRVALDRQRERVEARHGGGAFVELVERDRVRKLGRHRRDDLDVVAHQRSDDHLGAGRAGGLDGGQHAVLAVRVDLRAQAAAGRFRGRQEARADGVGGARVRGRVERQHQRDVDGGRRGGGFRGGRRRSPASLAGGVCATENAAAMANARLASRATIGAKDRRQAPGADMT